MTLLPTGQLTTTAHRRCGVALGGPGWESAAPLTAPDSVPDAVSRPILDDVSDGRRGRWTVGAAGPVGEPPAAGVDEVRALAGRMRREQAAARDGTVRLIVECAWRRVTVADPEGAVREKVERWRRVTAFQRPAGAPVAGTQTARAAPADPGPDGLLDLGWAGEERLAAVTAQAREQGLRLVGAPAPPAGTWNVVLEPEAAGVLVHELVGHLLERDNVERYRDPAALRRGRRIAPDGFTVTHDGTPNGDWCGADIDDTGAGTGRSDLLRDGVVVAHLGPGGPGLVAHRRRAGYHRPALPRMATLAVAAGSAEPADDDALVVGSVREASMDPATGRCCAVLREASVPGRSGVRRTTAGGVLECDITTALASLDGIGVGRRAGSALCTKGAQLLPTGALAPRLRFVGMELR